MKRRWDGVTMTIVVVVLPVLAAGILYLLLLWKLPGFLEWMHRGPIGNENQLVWAANLLQACVVFGGIASLLLAVRQVRSAERTGADKRFMWAVEQLDRSSQLDARLGALRILTALAGEHPEQYGALIRDVLEYRFRAHRMIATADSGEERTRTPLEEERQSVPDLRALDLEECVRYLVEDREEPLAIVGGNVALPIRIHGGQAGRVSIIGRDVTFLRTSFAQCEFKELRGCRLIRCRLEDCAFETAAIDVRFEECEFVECGLANTDWKRTRLQASTFRSCDLTAGSFRGVKASNVQFQQSQLQNADFHGADLTESIWDEVNVDGASWQDADVTRAKVERADLTAVVGLTQEQLEAMQPAIRVQLPSQLTEPVRWRPQAGSEPAAPPRLFSGANAGPIGG